VYDWVGQRKGFCFLQNKIKLRFLKELTDVQSPKILAGANSFSEMMKAALVSHHNLSVCDSRHKFTERMAIITTSQIFHHSNW
jgi:hypothetical protein